MSFWRVIACPSWAKIRQGRRREKTSCRMHYKKLVNIAENITWYNLQEIHWTLMFNKKCSKYFCSLTPLRSFLPFAERIFTYLEAIRQPIKHIVKTLAIGNTANKMVETRDCPLPSTLSITTEIRDLSILFYSSTLSNPHSRISVQVAQQLNFWHQEIIRFQKSEQHQWRKRWPNPNLPRYELSEKSKCSSNKKLTTAEKKLTL